MIAHELARCAASVQYVTNDFLMNVVATMLITIPRISRISPQ